MNAENSKPNSQPALEIIHQAWKDGRPIVPFFGAGISVGAGFPLTSELREYFCKVLFYIRNGGFEDILDSNRFLNQIEKATNNRWPTRDSTPAKYLANFGWPDFFRINADLTQIYDVLGNRCIVKKDRATGKQPTSTLPETWEELLVRYGSDHKPSLNQTDDNRLQAHLASLQNSVSEQERCEILKLCAKRRQLDEPFCKEWKDLSSLLPKNARKNKIFLKDQTVSASERARLCRVFDYVRGVRKFGWADDRNWLDAIVQTEILNIMNLEDSDRVRTLEPKVWRKELRLRVDWFRLLLELVEGRMGLADLLFSTLNRNREPSAGHIAIAHLACRMGWPMILTLNHDTLLKRAFQSERLPYKVFDINKDSSLPDVVVVASEWMSMIKLHGSAYGLRLGEPTNLELDIQTRETIRTYIPPRALIVVAGFSGYERRMMSLIESVCLQATNDRNDTKVLWLHQETLDRIPRPVEVLEQKSLELGKSVFVKDQIHDAGLFFLGVYQHLVHKLPRSRASYECFPKRLYKTSTDSTSSLQASDDPRVDLRSLASFIVRPDECDTVRIEISKFEIEIRKLAEQVKNEKVETEVGNRYPDLFFNAASTLSRRLAILSPSLHLSQRVQRENAFSSVVQALEDAVLYADEVAKQTGANDRRTSMLLNSTRCNRTLMLSGDRGMGKTSIMMSLQSAFLDPRSWSRRAATNQNGSDDRSKEWLDLNVNFESIKDRIIWLETLDMEPLPSPANLLVAILARIDQSIRIESFQSHGTELDFRSQGDSILLELRRLITDASLAWNGNVEERAASLDPDVYASEVLRAEESRLRLNPRLDLILNRVAHEVRWSHVSQPIFVLPVDDVDLNPVRCLELLRLIRVVNTPRLITIVLGDAAETERVLALKLSGEMSRIANTRNAGDVFLHDLYENVISLANQSMRKLIPPSQRFALKQMTIGEALAYTPKRNAQSLGELLGKWKIELELPSSEAPGDYPLPAIETLRDLLLAPSLIRSSELNSNSVDIDSSQIGKNQVASEQIGESKPDTQFVYRAAKLLNAPPRIVSDLWSRLSEKNSDYATDWETRELLRGLSSEALAYDTKLTVESRRQIGELLQGIATDHCFRTEHLFIRNEQISSSYMQGRFQGLANEYVFRDLVEQRTRSKGPLIKRYESSYEQRQERDSKEIPEYRSLEMGDATEGYLSVLHDSVSLRENHPIIGPWLVEDAGNLNIARVQWNAGGESVSVCWVGAIFRSFLELDQFTHAWRHCLRASKVSKRGNTEINPQTIQEMACHWIGIGCALLLGETYHPSDFVDLEHDSPKYDILGLVKKMECLIGNTRKFGIWRRDRTLLHFAVLLSFESGIPSEFSGPFWESETLVRFWKGRQSDIQRIRSRLLGVNRFEWNNLQKAVAKPRNLVKDIHDQLLGGPSGHRDRKEPLDSKDEPILKILEGIVRGESLNDEAPTRKLGTLLRKSSFGKKYGKPGALLESFIAIIESSLIHPSNRISGICFDDETN